MRTKGTLTSWNEEKGYGFISPMSGGKQIFVHIKTFKNRSRRPELGQIVTYNISSDQQGRPCAANATLAGDKLREQDKKKTGASFIAIAVIFVGIVGAAVLAGKLPAIILVFYLALSLITFGAYALDKSAAQKGAWRTKESTLHFLSLAGGWPGALIAQQKLRHKSKKESFRFVFWVTVALNLSGFFWLFSAKGQRFTNTEFPASKHTMGLTKGSRRPQTTHRAWGLNYRLWCLRGLGRLSHTLGNSADCQEPTAEKLRF